MCRVSTDGIREAFNSKYLLFTCFVFFFNSNFVFVIITQKYLIFSFNVSTDSGNTEGGWSEWSDWSECSRQCGGGRQHRTRTCDGAGYRPSDCDGPTLMERACNLQPCKGVWSCWTDWSACSVTCGQGTRSRSRICSIEGGDPSNELDVEGCVGPSEMKEYCNNPSCERKFLLKNELLYK